MDTVLFFIYYLSQGRVSGTVSGAFAFTKVACLGLLGAIWGVCQMLSTLIMTIHSQTKKWNFQWICGASGARIRQTLARNPVLTGPICPSSGREAVILFWLPWFKYLGSVSNTPNSILNYWRNVSMFLWKRLGKIIVYNCHYVKKYLLIKGKLIFP